MDRLEQMQTTGTGMEAFEYVPQTGEYADQLRKNLGAVGWNLSPEQVARLDAVSRREPPYPYWHQRGFDRNPAPTRW